MISSDIPKTYEFLENDKLMQTSLSNMIYTTIENLNLKIKDGKTKIIDYPFNEN